MILSTILSNSQQEAKGKEAETRTKVKRETEKVTVLECSDLEWKNKVL